MSGLAVTLVLISAVMHATWNALARRSAEPFAFLFAIAVAGVTIYTLPATVVVASEGLELDGLPWLLASGLLQMVYTVTLGQAYRHGALSLAYPVARGTGVLLVPLLAILLLDERPTALAWLGIATIAVGLLLINVLGARERAASELERGQRGIAFAFLTGLVITSYSLVDKVGVSHIHPLVYVYGLVLIEVALLAPVVALRHRAAVARVWRVSWRAVLVGGLLNIGTYLIVLVALRIGGSQVGYIVPLRETSIVVAALLGILVLGERAGAARLAGCGCVALGVLAIAFGG